MTNPPRVARRVGGGTGWKAASPFVDCFKPAGQQLVARGETLHSISLFPASHELLLKGGGQEGCKQIGSLTVLLLRE